MKKNNLNKMNLFLNLQ